MQGNLVDPVAPICPEHGWSILFELDHLQLASRSTSIDFARVFSTFDWLDTHMFLPCYALPPEFPFCQPVLIGPGSGGHQVLGALS